MSSRSGTSSSALALPPPAPALPLAARRRGSGPALVVPPAGQSASSSRPAPSRTPSASSFASSSSSRAHAPAPAPSAPLLVRHPTPSDRLLGSLASQRPPASSTSSSGAPSPSPGFAVLRGARGGGEADHAARLAPASSSRASRDVSGGTFSDGGRHSSSLHPDEDESEFGSVYSEEVVETETIQTRTDPSTGRKCVNQYVIFHELGKGQHGHVRLAKDVNDETYWAIKMVPRQSKKRLPGHSSSTKPVIPGASVMEEKLKKEIAILKKLRHPNVVRLKEVIDAKDSPKIFLVLEFMEGGEVKWKTEDSTPLLTTEQTRCIFRDVVLGLEYLHHQGIIHRDIKPANLLWSQDHSLVKISDFGVSHYSSVLRLASTGEGDSLETEHYAALDEEALAKTAGSPAFFAPELCHQGDYTPLASMSPSASNSTMHDSYSFPPSGPSHPTSSGSASSTAPNGSRRRERPKITKALDVWALGVTLYCLLFARVPFEAASEFALFAIIPTEEYDVPPFMGADAMPTGGKKPGKDVPWEARELSDLLARMLDKNPLTRITLKEVKTHPWVLRGIKDSEAWLVDTDPGSDFVTVTKDEVASAFTETFSDRIKRTASKLKHKLFHSSSSSSSHQSRPGGARMRAKSSATLAGSEWDDDPRMFAQSGSGSTTASGSGKLSGSTSGKSSTVQSPTLRGAGLVSPPPSLGSRANSFAQTSSSSRSAVVSTSGSASGSTTADGQSSLSSPALSTRPSFLQTVVPASNSTSPHQPSRELPDFGSPPRGSRYPSPSSPQIPGGVNQDRRWSNASSSTSAAAAAASSISFASPSHGHPGAVRRLSNHLQPFVRRLAESSSNEHLSSSSASSSVGRRSSEQHHHQPHHPSSLNPIEQTRSRSPLPPFSTAPGSSSGRSLQHSLTDGLRSPKIKVKEQIARLFGKRPKRDGAGPTSEAMGVGRSSSSGEGQSGDEGTAGLTEEAGAGAASLSGFDARLSLEDARASSSSFERTLSSSLRGMELGSLPRIADEGGGLGFHLGAGSPTSPRAHPTLATGATPTRSSRAAVAQTTSTWTPQPLLSPALRADGAARLLHFDVGQGDHDEDEPLDLDEGLDFSDDDDYDDDAANFARTPARTGGSGELDTQWSMDRNGWHLGGAVLGRSESREGNLPRPYGVSLDPQDYDDAEEPATEGEDLDDGELQRHAQHHLAAVIQEEPLLEDLTQSGSTLSSSASPFSVPPSSRSPTALPLFSSSAFSPSHTINDDTPKALRPSVASSSLFRPGSRSPSPTPSPSWSPTTSSPTSAIPQNYVQPPTIRALPPVQSSSRGSPPPLPLARPVPPLSSHNPSSISRSRGILDLGSSSSEEDDEVEDEDEDGAFADGSENGDRADLEDDDDDDDGLEFTFGGRRSLVSTPVLPV